MALKKGYLILYNFSSAIAWATILGRTLGILALHGPGLVYHGVGDFTRLTQTMAALEVAHSALGIVRAPLFTTVMQVASRLFLVWPIVNTFPFIAESPAYTTMLLAWSITEVIRYLYFASALTGVRSGALTWLRYNTFFVLYPVGILSEVTLIYKAILPAGRWNAAFPLVMYAILAAYIPGSYILYTYMMKQRRKVMNNTTKASAKPE